MPLTLRALRNDDGALASPGVWESVTIVHVLCQVAEGHSVDHLQAQPARSMSDESFASHGLEEVAFRLSQFLLGLLSADAQDQFPTSRPVGVERRSIASFALQSWQRASAPLSVDAVLHAMPSSTQLALSF